MGTRDGVQAQAMDLETAPSPSQAHFSGSALDEGVALGLAVADPVQEAEMVEVRVAERLAVRLALVLHVTVGDGEDVNVGVNEGRDDFQAPGKGPHTPGMGPARWMHRSKREEMAHLAAQMQSVLRLPSPKATSLFHMLPSHHAP